jgi:hypothetical protein
LAAILDSLSSPQQNSNVLKIFQKNSRKKFVSFGVTLIGFEKSRASFKRPSLPSEIDLATILDLLSSPQQNSNVLKILQKISRKKIVSFGVTLIGFEKSRVSF